MPPDFIVENHGTIVRIFPKTVEASAWVEENVSDETFPFTGCLNCDHRPGWGLVDVIEDAGFLVEVRHPVAC